MAAKLKHNHTPNPFGAYQAPGDCPRCDQLRADKEAMGETQHNHARQPFGRHVDGCPRCAELAKGAAPRESREARQARLEREHLEGMRRHFADPHSSCDHITCYDW